VEYRLVSDKDLNEKISLFSTSIWKLLECRDAGRIDLMMDNNNELIFIEINPLAGIHPTHSDLPILWSMLKRDYNDLIKLIVNSVRKRTGL
jgi:D-alanine-D-alanine ligase